MGENMSMLKSSLSIGFLVVAFAFASAAYAGSPQVVAMDATFITKTNTNAQDPHLDVKVYNNRHVLIAENDGIPGTWGNGAINSIALDLKSPATQADLASGKIELDIHPTGKQDWTFDYNLSITYSDNTVIWERWNGKRLTQTGPTTSDTLTGK